MTKGTSIRVVCRFRPLNKLEIGLGGETCIDINNNQVQVTQTKKGNKKNKFTFDKIFGPKTTQQGFFEVVGKPILEHSMNGFNGTIFAYGQTSSGKTFTMEGPSLDDPEYKGLIPRVMDEVFVMIENAAEKFEFTIKVSMLEIYNERIQDLLDKKKNNLKIRQTKKQGIFVAGATEVYVASADEMKNTMKIGSSNRTVAATRMNAVSSRSHLIFCIKIGKKDLETEEITNSRLYFVDLAGSEKVSKTNVRGSQLNEAKNINKSLTNLGLVINALVEKSKFVPYRNSKLTRMLQESIGGNSLTTLVIAASMCTYNEDETLGTLNFGQRAKSIKNKAKANVERSAKELERLLKLANDKLKNYENLIKKLGAGSMLKDGSSLPGIQEEDEDQKEVKSSKSEVETLDKSSQTELKIKILETQAEINELQEELEVVEDDIDVTSGQGGVEEEKVLSGGVSNSENKEEEGNEQKEAEDDKKEEKKEGVIESLISPNKNAKKSTLISQALHIINKTHEIKRLEQENKNLKDDLELKNQKLEEANSEIRKLNEKFTNYSCESRSLLESIQGEFESNLAVFQERESKLERLGRDLEELRMKFIFLSNDSELISNKIQREDKLDSEGIEKVIQKFDNVKIFSEDTTKIIEDIQISHINKNEKMTTQMHQMIIEKIHKFLEGNELDHSTDLTFQQPSFMKDTFGGMDEQSLFKSTTNFEIDEADVSKIKKDSNNSSTLVSQDADKDLLEAINQSSDDSGNDYQALLVNQRSNIDNLYKRISDLESKLHSYKNQKDDLKTRMKGALKDASTKAQLRVKQFEKEIEKITQENKKILEEKKSLEDSNDEMVKEKNSKITKLETEILRLKNAIERNSDAQKVLNLENQIIKLASERQTFFNYRFTMERTIQEKTELIEEKDLQVKMMKAQLTILADEIDSIKKKQKDSYGGLIPRNIVKTIRGGGKGVKQTANVTPKQPAHANPFFKTKGFKNSLPKNSVQIGDGGGFTTARNKRSVSINKSRFIKNKKFAAGNLDKDFKKATTFKQRQLSKNRGSMSQNVLRGIQAYKKNRNVKGKRDVNKPQRRFRMKDQEQSRYEDPGRLNFTEGHEFDQGPPVQKPRPKMPSRKDPKSSSSRGFMGTFSNLFGGGK